MENDLQLRGSYESLPPCSTLWRMQLLNQAPLYLTLILGRLPTFTLPVTTSSAATSSNLHHTSAPTLSNCPYSALEPTPHITSNLTFTLPMPTHTLLMTNANAHLTSPSKSWVMTSTPFYSVPTLSPSPNPPSSALPAPIADMTSATLVLTHPTSTNQLHPFCVAPCQYRVATISRLLKIIGLFGRISSLLSGSFAKETYNFKEPTDRSHLIPVCVYMCVFICAT